MEFFLQIVGGIVISIILLILGTYLFFKIKFGKYLSLKHLSLNEEQSQTPLIIHLNEDFSPSWLEKQAKPIAQELTQLGFIRDKSYIIPEMQGFRLTAYFKPPLTAVLYQHGIVGIWADFVLEQEKLELTVTNCPLGEAAEVRPEKQINYFKGYSVSQLYERINTYIDNNLSYKTVDSDNFREYFEETYKKDMFYRARNGGISFDEFLGHTREFGKKISEKNIREAFIVTKLQELHQWHEVAIKGYLDDLPTEDEDEYALFIVPFRTDAEAFIRYLEEHYFIDDEDNISATFKEETDIFKLFDKLNDGKSSDLRATFMADVSSPLQLKIYKNIY